MNKTLIKEQLEKAANALMQKQPNLFKFTSETHQTEWNIAHHFAIELHKLFPDYDCDLDVIKPNLDRKRPDIILHERGSQNANFLVVEVKRDRNDVEGDLNKIKKYWFDGRLKYQFGAAVVIREGEDVLVRAIRNIASRKMIGYLLVALVA